MLRWMGPRGKDLSGKRRSSEVTDDPLAAIDPARKDQGIYSVSRSVILPRIRTKTDDDGDDKERGGGWDNSRNFCNLRVNPLFVDNYRETTIQRPPRKPKTTPSRSSRLSTPSAEKSTSSGYGGSNSYTNEPIFTNTVKLKDDAVSIIEQNQQYVKSIKVATRAKNKSTHSNSSGTLSTIPEGRVDFSIPRPIWPNKNQRHGPDYDSLVDEAVLLYTSLSYRPENVKHGSAEVSIREILVELLNNINATMEGKGVLSPEEMLKRVNEKIMLSLDALKNATEEEMRMLCVNLSNSKNVNSVIRAFSNSSSSGHSSQSSPEWSRSRIRSVPSESEDIYQVPSGSSSSGFSDAKGGFDAAPLPVFVHEDLSSVPNGVRNAMIYGTLCRTSFKSGDKIVDKSDGVVGTSKKNLIKTEDDKPSVWEQYYGVNVAGGGDVNGMGYVPKPTDVPVFPGGRPEADFTLDIPRSELLSKRMKQEKKWRCRCRLLTTFLGLVFFLLSVMAVSLMLTRGQRMFGSML